MRPSLSPRNSLCGLIATTTPFQEKSAQLTHANQFAHGGLTWHVTASLPVADPRAKLARNQETEASWGHGTRLPPQRRFACEEGIAAEALTYLYAILAAPIPGTELVPLQIDGEAVLSAAREHAVI